MNENDILGFDPSQLSVLNPNQPASSGSSNPLIYHPRPSESKSEDGIYRAQIKVIYNPFDLRQSVLEQQSYAFQDDNGFFSVVSSLTANDKNCPVFKAWKACHFSKDLNMQKQALSKDKGGRQLFDKRFARYVTIQVIEDNNKPELNGCYLFWKMPKFIWDAINAKMTPTSDKKAKIPVMDFLFGRAIDLEVTPGPDDPKAPERKTREISYSTSEVTEDIVSCTNPDGTPLLTPAQQAVLDEFIEQMTKRVWKEKDPEARKNADAEIKASENTKELGKIYRGVVEQIKSFCPNLIDELGYKPWSPEITERVNAWINIVLSGRDPQEVYSAPAVLNADNTAAATAVANPAQVAAAAAPAPAPASVAAAPSDDDLPF